MYFLSCRLWIQNVLLYDPCGLYGVTKWSKDTRLGVSSLFLPVYFLHFSILKLLNSYVHFSLFQHSDYEYSHIFCIPKSLFQKVSLVYSFGFCSFSPFYILLSLLSSKTTFYSHLHIGLSSMQTIFLHPFYYDIIPSQPFSFTL